LERRVKVRLRDSPRREQVLLDTATNLGIRGWNAGLRPDGSGAGPGNAAGPKAGAPVVVSRRARREPRGHFSGDTAGRCL